MRLLKELETEKIVELKLHDKSMTAMNTEQAVSGIKKTVENIREEYLKIEEIVASLNKTGGKTE